MHVHFRALSGRLKFTVRRHKSNTDSLSCEHNLIRASIQFEYDLETKETKITAQLDPDSYSKACVQ